MQVGYTADGALRWRLIAVPGRLIRRVRHLALRLAPSHSLLPEVLGRPLRNR
jgi:hypothetical protein